MTPINDIIQKVVVEFKLDANKLIVNPVIGGDISDAYFVSDGANSLFIKVNSKTSFPHMFEKEKIGLETINNSISIPTPKSYYIINHKSVSSLLLDFIQEEDKNDEFWKNLGVGLANMHRSTGKRFGFEDSNYIGSLVQLNLQKDSWSEFFIECRLQPQLKMAYDKGLITDKSSFETLFKSIDSLYPQEKPSLVHGDLWSGNILCGPNQKAYLIDPAVYYGHREMDIAMTQLFGGFSDTFLNSYLEVNPLEIGWQERVSLWNIYPLLVHVNLFGSSYSQQVMNCVRKFI